MPKHIVVKLVTRPTIKGKRRWEKVNLKKIYPDGTGFILRWLPKSAKQYSYRTLGAVTLRDAEIARASFVPAVEPEKKTESVNSKTLEEYRAVFLHDKETSTRSDGTPLDPDTVRTYNLVTRQFLNGMQHTLPAEIDRLDLKSWLATLRERGLMHSTVCDYYRHIVNFLNFCGVDHKKLVPKNERPRPVETVPEAYSAEEMKKFFFNIIDECDGLAFEFLLKTGAREKEMTHLIWSDLNLDKNTVKFRFVDGFRTKFGKSRIVPLEKSLVAKLLGWREKNPTTKLVFGKDDKVWNNYLKDCKKIVKRAGMNPVDFWLHKFRDTFATWALRRGVDIRTVQHWLGHRSIGMTQKYLAPEQGKAAQDHINRAFGGADVGTAVNDTMEELEP
jgi:integrase